MKVYTYAFIISFNRLTPLQRLCKDLLDRECIPVIIDNGSTYQPLIDWLIKTHYTVIHLNPKDDHKSPWYSGVIKAYAKGRDYIVTDCDLDISTVPLDMVEHLKAGFEVESVLKVGLSLEINDLPANPYTADVQQWESRFWEAKRGGYYLADIDTTLALYDGKREIDKSMFGKRAFYSALRADRPYTAKHLPWYNVPPLSDEEQYLHDHTNHHGYWKTKFKEHFKV